MWCQLFHRRKHVCWDDFFGQPIPGDKSWVCQKCGRFWSTANPHKFPSECDSPVIWGELWASGVENKPGRLVFLGPLPKGVRKAMPRCIIEEIETRGEKTDA